MFAAKSCCSNMSIALKQLVTRLLLLIGMVHTTAKPSKRQRSSTRTGRAAKPSQRSRPATALKSANAQYRALLRYLRAAVGVMPKAECQLLLEFAEIAKQKCARLRRTVRPCSRPRAAWPAVEA